MIKIHPVLKINVTMLYLKSYYIQKECYDSRFEIIAGRVDGFGMSHQTFCNEVYMRSLVLPVSDVILRFKHFSPRDSPELLAFYQVFDPNTTYALRQENTSVLQYVLLGLQNHGLYVLHMKREVYWIYHFHTGINQRVRATVQIWCVTSRRDRALPISVQIYDGPYSVIQPPNWETDLRVPIIGHLVACGESSTSDNSTEKVMETRSSIGDLTLVIMTLESQAKTVYGNATLSGEFLPCPDIFCTLQNTILADQPDSHHDPALYQRVINHDLHTTQTVIHFISTFNAAKFGRLVFLSINISDDYISDCAVNSIILTAHHLLGIFCSRIMMSYLTSKPMQDEGILFSDFCYIFFSGYAFGGKRSLTYRLSLSECSVVINLCENGLSDPYGVNLWGYFAMNSRLALQTSYDFTLSRRPYRCVKLYGMPSDSSVTTGQESKECSIKITRMDNTLFNQVTVKVSDALLPGGTHDKECSALVKVQRISPTGIMPEVEAIRPTITKEYIVKDFLLWANRGCPWIGSFFIVTITNPEESCLPLKDHANFVSIVTVCGSVAIESAGLDYKIERPWVFTLVVSTSHEDTMRTCCYMDFTVNFTCIRGEDAPQFAIEVVDFSKRNDSVIPTDKNVMRYQFYPYTDFQFVVSLEFRMKNGHIVIHGRNSNVFDGDGRPCVGETSIASYPKGSSMFNITYNRRYVDRLYSAIVIGPGFGLCSQSPIPYTWWQSCDVHCYLFYRPHSPLSWTEDSQYCKERGGHLITPHTDAEWKRLLKWSHTGTQNGVDLPSFEVYRAEIFNERLFFVGLRRNNTVSRFHKRCTL